MLQTPCYIIFCGSMCKMIVYGAAHCHDISLPQHGPGRYLPPIKESPGGTTIVPNLRKYPPGDFKLPYVSRWQRSKGNSKLLILCGHTKPVTER